MPNPADTAMKHLNSVLTAGAVFTLSMLSSRASTLSFPDEFNSFVIPGTSETIHDWLDANKPQWFQGSFQMIIPANHLDVSPSNVKFNYYAIQFDNKFYLAVTNEGSGSASRDYIAKSLAFDLGNSLVTSTNLILPPSFLITPRNDYSLPEGSFLNPDFIIPADSAYTGLDNPLLRIGNFQLFLAELKTTGSETLANLQNEFSTGALRVGMNVSQENNVALTFSEDRCVEPPGSGDFSVVTNYTDSIPEPTTVSLSLLGLSALLLRRKRQAH